MIEYNFWEEHLKKASFYDVYFEKIYGKESGARKIPLGDLWWIKEQFWGFHNLANGAAEAKYYEACLNLLTETENKHKEIFCEFLENLGFVKTAPNCYDLPSDK